jgi:hypothetical protein
VSFAIRLVDGEAINVVQPDFVALSPDGRSAFAFRASGSSQFLDVRDMVSIDPL